jgi:hypothetical protein
LDFGIFGYQHKLLFSGDRVRGASEHIAGGGHRRKPQEISSRQTVLLYMVYRMVWHNDLPSIVSGFSCQQTDDRGQKTACDEEFDCGFIRLELMADSTLSPTFGLSVRPIYIQPELVEGSRVVESVSDKVLRPPALPSVFCHLTSVIWQLKPWP